MAQVPDDLFDVNRVSNAWEDGYARRMGTLGGRVREALRIDEVPKGMIAAIVLLMAVATLLGAALLRSCGGESLVVDGRGERPAAREEETPAGERYEEPGVYVYVAGAVLHPGVYSLPPGSRVCDAIEAAGGTLDEADLYPLNLALVLSDSQKVYVPNAAAADGGQMYENETFSSPVVNINLAGEQELQGLVGIGPSLARAIVEDREANGPFMDVSDLTRVAGIGEKTLERFASDVCV